MIFSIIIIILIGVVAFFHYTQGFFSATMSAVIAVLAATLAVGYHEAVVDWLLQGKMPDYANAMILMVLFALVYFILRAAFDAMVPGNVRFAPIVDKIGAGAMGLVAALFSVGVVALAAQEMPFGPTLAGYSRFDLKDIRQVVVPQEGGQSLDAEVHDELKVEKKLEAAPQNHLLVPADDLVVGLTSKLSDNGSLAGAQPVTDVHPDWIAELSAARFGIQNGAKKTASSQRGQAAVNVQGAYTSPALNQIDGMLPDVRGTRDEALAPILKPSEGETIVIIRTTFATSAADTDSIVRFSCASIRLKTADDHDFYPVGTLENHVLVADKPDDYLFCESGHGVDLVFVVPTDVVKSKDELKFPAGTFLEVKKMTRIDLSDKTITHGLPPAAENIGTVRQSGIRKKIGEAPASPAAQPQQRKGTGVIKSTGGEFNNPDNPVDKLPGRGLGL